MAITGTYVLVTFAPHTSTHITAHLVQYYAISWHFLLYLVCPLKCSLISQVTHINVYSFNNIFYLSVTEKPHVITECIIVSFIAQHCGHVTENPNVAHHCWLKTWSLFTTSCCLVTFSKQSEVFSTTTLRGCSRSSVLSCVSLL